MQIDQLDPDAIGEQLRSMFGAAGVRGRLLAGVAQDDCASVEFPAQTLVLSSDFVNASPIGLELGIADHQDLGYYLVACNLSDLVGTGANPLGILINIMWSRKSPESGFWEILEGVKHATEMYDTPVLGGDTKLTSGNTILNGTAVGTANDSSELFLQGRSQVGDGIWVSGSLGSCAGAVLGWSQRSELGTEWTNWARTSITRPKLPLPLSRAVSSLRLSMAGADISDGFAADIGSICRQSRVGAVIDLSEVPVHPQVDAVASRLGVHPASFALSVGGDLQFAVTTSGAEEALRNLGMVRVGEIVQERVLAVEFDSRILEIPDAGHRDVRSQSFAVEIEALIRGLPFND